MIRILQTNRHGYTLVEILIVVAIIALMTSIAVPTFLRSRARSQATVMLNNLRIIDAAKEQYATDTGRATGLVTAGTIAVYLKSGTSLSAWASANAEAPAILDEKVGDIRYQLNPIGELPSVTSGTPEDLAIIWETTGEEFWSPFSVHR